jgi:hypothetical protein
MQPTTGTRYPMVAMAPESVGNHHSGTQLSTWLNRRGCDQRDINRISAGRKWAYGSFRPSDRAALLVDAAPILTPFADDLIAAD